MLIEKKSLKFQRQLKINLKGLIDLGKAKVALKDYKNALVDFKNYIFLEKNEEVEQLIKTCEENLTSN